MSAVYNLIEYTLPQSPAEYKPLPRQTLELSFAEKQAKCPPKWGKVILSPPGGRPGGAKKPVRETRRAFLHTKRDIACAAHGSRSVKENSRRRRTCARYPKKQEEKDFTLSRVLFPCCNHIVTLLKPFCNRVLSLFCNFFC